MKRKNIIRWIIVLLFIIGILIFLREVGAYSEYGAPSEFGNLSTTTAWIGGDYGILNITGNADIEGNVTANYFIGNGSKLTGIDTDIDSLDWNKLKNYPTSCPDGTYVTEIGDSTTCTGITDNWVDESGDTMTGDLNVEGNINSTGWMNVPESSAYKIGGTDFIRNNYSAGSIAIGNTTADISSSNVVVMGKGAGRRSGSDFFALGADAGYSSGNNFVAIGDGAGQGAGDNFFAMGYLSGLSSGDNFVALGRVAGYLAEGTYTAVGLGAGREAGSEFTGIGLNALRSAGSYSIGIGDSAGYYSGDRVTSIGYESTFSAVTSTPENINDSIAIGYKSAPQFDGHFVLQQANLNSEPLIEGDLNTGSTAFGSNTLSGLNDGDINVSTTNSDVLKLKETTLPTCDSSTEGEIRYNGTSHYGCEGSSWIALY